MSAVLGVMIKQYIGLQAAVLYQYSMSVLPYCLGLYYQAVGPVH